MNLDDEVYPRGMTLLIIFYFLYILMFGHLKPFWLGRVPLPGRGLKNSIGPCWEHAFYPPLRAFDKQINQSRARPSLSGPHTPGGNILQPWSRQDQVQGNPIPGIRTYNPKLTKTLRILNFSLCLVFLFPGKPK